jgi:Ice-binding-like
MSNSLGNNGGRFYSSLIRPVLNDCNFVVDNTNGNGLGIRNLKGDSVKSVIMNTGGAPPLSIPFGTARSFGLLASTAISNTGSTVVTGNLGLTPGTSVTGFPPGVYTGALDVDNTAATNAKTSAQATYTYLAALPAGTTEGALDGLTLLPGTYTSATSMSLAGSAAGTLTLNAAGNPNAIWVFQIGSTLTTGAGGIATIALINGASAANVYWQVGSSATINITPGSVFQGNIIAEVSVTIDSGTANGTMAALTGAVTIASASNISTVALPIVPGGILPGYAWIQLKDNYSRYAFGGWGMVSPVAGSPIAINGTALTVGQPYIIVSVGHATAGTVTIMPVADVAGSLASTWFRMYDAYGNTFVIWFSVSGVGSAPQLPIGLANATLVQQSIAINSSAATIGAALVVTLENLLATQLLNPSGPVGVYSYTASGTTTVTVVSTATNPYGPLPGGPMDGLIPTGFTFSVIDYSTNIQDWQGVGLPRGVIPNIGASFVATTTGYAIGGGSTGLVQVPGISGISDVEVIGDPNQEIAPIPMGGSPNRGAWFLIQFLAPTSSSVTTLVPTAPANGTVVALTFYLEQSSILIAGE